MSTETLNIYPSDTPIKIAEGKYLIPGYRFAASSTEILKDWRIGTPNSYDKIYYYNRAEEQENDIR